MKSRKLIVSILGVLLASSVLPAQEAGTSEPAAPVEEKVKRAYEAQVQAQIEAEARSEAAKLAARQRARSSIEKTSTEVQIFKLRHIEAKEVASLIVDVCRVQAVSVAHTNSIVVNTTAEQMESVANLIKAVDVERPETPKPRDTQDFIYRIYMFEIASEDRGMKAFSMTLQTSGQISSQEFLNAVAEDIQIVEFGQTSDGPPDAQQFDIMIQGKAVSDEAVKRLVEKFPESSIIELKWDDDETFTDKIEAAHYTQLPDQMQNHIHRFLGDDIRTVGYWFGNLSVPGGIKAPIGPWTLNLMLAAESDGMVQLQVDVEVPGEVQLIRGRPMAMRNDRVLSNTLRAKIGKPIIIGYNRESYGTRKMGAMVIIPEEDFL